MRDDFHDLQYFEATQRETLFRFFPEHMTSRMSDWQQASWLDIMRRSRFGKLTERSATELVLYRVPRLCTTCLAVYDGMLRFYISDGDNVSAVRVDLLNGYALEQLRQKLSLYLLPASVTPTKDETRRRELLLHTLERCFEEPTFILA